MYEIIKLIANNPLTTIFSIILAIIGVICSVVFFYKSRKVKKPKITMRSVNLLKNSVNKIDGINILYKNDSIPNLTVTKLAIWNAGNETINSDDIANADKLLIKTNNDIKILETQILFQKNKCNLLELNEIEEGKTIELKFDYLDYMEGGVIQILHTGNSTNDISISGTIKGVGKLKAESEKKRKDSKLDKLITKYRNFVKLIAAMGIIIVVMLCIVAIIIIIISNTSISDKIVNTIMLGGLGACYSFLEYKLLKKTVPRGFEAFKDNI